MTIVIIILYVILMIICTAVQVRYMDIDDKMGVFLIALGSIFWPIFAFLSIVAGIAQKIVKRK